MFDSRLTLSPSPQTILRASQVCLGWEGQAASNRFPTFSEKNKESYEIIDNIKEVVAGLGFAAGYERIRSQQGLVQCVRARNRERTSTGPGRIPAQMGWNRAER